MLVYGRAPREERIGDIFPFENGQWTLAYYEAMEDAGPVSPTYLYKLPCDQRYSSFKARSANARHP